MRVDKKIERNEWVVIIDKKEWARYDNEQEALDVARSLNDVQDSGTVSVSSRRCTYWRGNILIDRNLDWDHETSEQVFA